MPPVFIHNMPAVNPNNPSQGGPQRTTFRPPWVKEGPTPLPMPTAPWTARGREAVGAAPEDPTKIEKPGPRKLSKVTIIPSQPTQDNAQEIISQASLKWNPKCPEKDAPTAVPFTAKRPSSFIKSQEGPGQSAAPSPRDTHRKESTTIPVVVESSKRKESTEKPIPVVVESSKRKESTEKSVPVAVEPSKRKESTEKSIPVVVESKRKSASEKPASSAVEPSGPRDRRKESVVQIKKEPEREPPKASREFAKPIPKPVEKELPKSILKDPSKTSIPSAPKAPPAPPMAPPPPPPPPPGKRGSIVKSDLTPVKAAKLDALRSRPRRRPDWTDMMKEVERGKQLRHVQCNDRSAPILPKEKAKGQFVYDSEKETTHSPHKQLLNQIQHGVKLKRVKCDDRSKPVLDGLRKFRRQMTIEEQIQKSMSMADVVAVAAEPDELDDIDKVRDDLQSTKQMLAQELRNKEALERENKRLMARLLNLEVELEKEKNTKKIDVERGAQAQATRSAADEKLVQQLKDEAFEANRVSKEMEDKYRGTAEELDATRAKLESAWLRNQQLELELKSRGSMPITKQPSSKKLAASMASMPNGKAAPISDDESEYTEETETESESEEEGNEADAAAVQERRIARELKLLATKLRSYKEKQARALKESHSLREQLRKQQKTLRQEKKKYKALQKEVDKMAKLMKDDEEEEEEEQKPDDEDEEEETESESESEESEEDDPTDGDLPDDSSVEDKRKNLTDRSKHHENRLGTLKKGNYLLKANIDRLQDDINRQREMSLSLQEDLNSVLAELG